MSNRRKFIAQTVVASVAMVLAGTSKSLGAVPESDKASTIKKNKLMLLHHHIAATNHLSALSIAKKIAVNKIRKKNAPTSHVLLLDEVPVNKSFSIYEYADLKVGVIRISNCDDCNEHNNINDVANTLRETHQCKLIVCLSHLDRPDTNGKFEQSLASRSTNIDIIIGNSASISHAPSIVLNKNAHEVFINHSLAESCHHLAEISISFDPAYQKNGIGFSTVSIV